MLEKMQSNCEINANQCETGTIHDKSLLPIKFSDLVFIQALTERHQIHQCE